jgi:hypothetical protein
MSNKDDDNDDYDDENSNSKVVEKIEDSFCS